METQNQDTIIYSLCIEDIQTVALEELDRELSDTEIESIVEQIGSNISWYDAIANAINDKIKL